MADLKQAYDEFVKALVDETGLVPKVEINFFTHWEENQAGKFPPVAAGVPRHIATQLGLPVPAYGENNGVGWFKTRNRCTEVTLYL